MPAGHNKHRFYFVPFFPRTAKTAVKRWKMLYAFGDSYSDSGAGYIDGNGLTSIAYAARDLGIPFTHAADPDAGGKGINFAVSGAPTGYAEGQRIKNALLGRGMRNQVRDFVERVCSGAVSFNPPETLFFIAGGLNDGKQPTKVITSNLANI